MTDAANLNRSAPSPVRGRARAFARKPGEAAGAALFALLALAAPVRADERVGFPSSSGERIGGYLAKPAGAGPFPAVVLLHTCLGLPANRAAIQRGFASAGYATLFVDDFAARGVTETCAVDFPQGAGDAYGALAFLAARPDVDPARIAVFGASQGGDTALTIATANGVAPGGASFRAAAAFYPPCANRDGAALKLPTLIVVGRADSVTPAADCEALAAAQPPGRVNLAVLPGGPHGFDLPEFGAGRSVLGMTLAHDSKAAAVAAAKLKAFLAKWLRP